MRRPMLGFFAGIFGAVSMQGTALGAPQAMPGNSVSGLEQFALSKKAQTECQNEVKKIGAALDRNRPVNLSAFEKRCPAFAFPIAVIKNMPPAQQKGALLLLFHGDIGSRGGRGCFRPGVFLDVC